MERLRRTAIAISVGAALVGMVLVAPAVQLQSAQYNPSLPTNPPWDPHHRSAQAESDFAGAARAMGIGTVIVKLFMSDGNLLYRVYRDIERKIESGPADSRWRPSDWIDLHKAAIRTDTQWRYMLTRNQAEAELLLADMQVQERDAALLVIKLGFKD